MANNGVSLKVLNPTGIDVTEKKRLADRPDNLDGKKIGLIWNNKPQSDVLLDEIGNLLKEKFPRSEIIHLNVTDCCTQLPQEELESLANKIDVGAFAGGD